MDDKDSKTHEPGSNRESQISVVVSDVGTPPGKAAEDTATEEAPMTEEAHRIRRLTMGYTSYSPPNPPPPGSSPLIVEAHARVEGYLDKIKALPYHMHVLTYGISKLKEDCKVKLFSLDETGCTDSTTVESAVDLEAHLISLVDKHSAPSEDCEILIARDPSPEVVRALGGYLDVPIEFFVSHAATGAVINVHHGDFEKYNTGDEQSSHTKDHMFSKKSGRNRNHEWYSVEYRRSAHLDPRLVDVKSAWACSSVHDAGGEMCLPYDFLSSRQIYGREIPVRYPHWTYLWDCDSDTQRARDIAVTTRILRPCWTIGQNPQVMFQQRVSVFKRMKGGIRCVLILVDALPVFGDDEATPLYTSVHSRDLHDEETPSDSTDLWEGIEGYIRQALENFDVSDIVDPMYSINVLEHLIYQQAAEFSREVLRFLGSSLDIIDRSISDAVQLRSRLDHWQYLSGVWRSVLPQMLEELASSSGRAEKIANTSSSLDDITTEYQSLIDSCRSLQERNERTSQAQMSTMSILESQNAMAQGRDLQRLTELAFVFVPLSFVASVFGMEVGEFEDPKPSIRLFLGIGIGLVFALYLTRAAFKSSIYITSSTAIQEDFQETMKDWYDGSDYRKASEMPKILGFRSKAHYLWLAIERSSTLLATTALLFESIPLVLLWSLQPEHWPPYIALTVSLIWSWIVLISWNIFAVTGATRFTRQATTPFCSGLFLQWLQRYPNSLYGRRMFWLFMGAVHGYTIAFAPLMIYVGDISAGSGSNPTVSLALAIVVPILTAIALGIFMYGIAMDKWGLWRLHGAYGGKLGVGNDRIRGFYTLWEDFKVVFGLQILESY